LLPHSGSRSCAARVALLLGFGVFGPTGVARAQLAVNRMEIVMRTGSSGERTSVVDVRNESNDTVQAVVRLEDWDRSSDGTNRWYQYGSQPGSCGSALSAFPRSVRLEPSASQSLRVTMDSTTAPEKECWAAVVVETTQPAVGERRALGYVLRTAVKVYVQPATSRANGEIVEFHLAADSGHAAPAATPGPQLQFGFANTGTQHVTARGSVEFRRLDNSVAAREAAPAVYALPGATQTARLAVPKLEKGRYIVILVLDYGGDEVIAAQLEYEVA
jgi:P pilus assembly chaperone PapD